MNNIEKKAEQLWGQDLHKEKSIPAHYHQLERIFPKYWNTFLKGHLLEIGCGSGADLEIFSRDSKFSSITAIDIGENVIEIANKYSDKPHISVQQGNALNLSHKNNAFDAIYSYGVFHHTSNPTQCISEAFRGLKKNGAMFTYLYSAHEDSLFKRTGIIIENWIMKLLRFFPYKIQTYFCILLSPICWLLLSLPSIVLRLLGKKNLASKLPFHFGTHPFSLIGDLKDRLMSPINHRFTKNEIEKILRSVGFICIDVVKTSSGLFIFARR